MATVCSISPAVRGPRTYEARSRRALDLDFKNVCGGPSFVSKTPKNEGATARATARWRRHRRRDTDGIGPDPEVSSGVSMGSVSALTATLSPPTFSKRQGRPPPGVLALVSPPSSHRFPSNFGGGPAGVGADRPCDLGRIDGGPVKRDPPGGSAANGRAARHRGVLALVSPRSFHRFPSKSHGRPGGIGPDPTQTLGRIGHGFMRNGFPPGHLPTLLYLSTTFLPLEYNHFHLHNPLTRHTGPHKASPTRGCVAMADTGPNEHHYHPPVPFSRSCHRLPRHRQRGRGPTRAVTCGAGSLRSYGPSRQYLA